MRLIFETHRGTWPNHLFFSIFSHLFPVKAVVHRLKISDLGHHYLSQIILIFNSIKTPACELYLVYSATFFVAETRVNCVLKIFKDDLKTSPNNNCMGASAEFFKFLRVEEAKL